MLDSKRFYPSVDEVENFTTKREIKEIEKNIKLVNREIRGDIIKSSIGAVVSVAGVFGTVYCGKNLIDLYTSNEALTLQTKFLAEWGEFGVGASIVAAVFAGIATVGYARSCVENIHDKKTYTKKLVNLKKRQQKLDSQN